MVKVLIGIAIGGALAIMFPNEAMQGFDLVRDSINTAANTVADKTQ